MSYKYYGQPVEIAKKFEDDKVHVVIKMADDYGLGCLKLVKIEELEMIGSC